MIQERLYINNIYIPLKTGLNPSITKSIADVNQPNKRNSTYSKTATVPDSVEAREVFGAIFNVNETNGTFDPTVKPTCKYIVGGNEIINGYCQLKKITKTDNKEITYDIVMYGEISDLFTNIKDAYLHDLDLSEWDHPWDKQLVEDSWATQVYNSDSAGYVAFALGQGYVYPLIDYGFSQDQTTFQLDHIGCAIYVKEYWDAIFSEAGFTYTSTFLDSTTFKSLIIPSSPEHYALSSSDISDRQFDADTPNFTSSASATSGNLTKESYGSNDVIIMTAENSDPSGLHDTTIGKYTVVDPGWYTISGNLEINATFTPASQPAKITSEVRGKIRVLLNSGVLDEEEFFITRDPSDAASSDWPYTSTATPTVGDSDYQLDSYHIDVVTYFTTPTDTPRPASVPDIYEFSTGSFYLAAGDEIELAVSAGFFKGYNSDYFEDAGGADVDGNATLTLSSGSLLNKVDNTTLSPGSTLEISKIIPKGVKQSDFVMSIVKMFNLYMEADPNDATNLIIEPRDDYYGSTVNDITAKIAQDRGIEYYPMGASDVKRFLYTYKEDKDYYNELYTTNHQEIYGEREITAQNEFNQKDEKNELIFSPTPLVALPYNDRVLPTILQVDDNQLPKNTKHNIRILYYGGLKNCSQAWLFQKVIGNTVYTQSYESQYPYAGHFDDPFNPTLDLNFGLIKEVFYDDVQPITVTNNNLWNAYWSSLIGEITDPDSRIVKCHVNISPKDFKVWSFQDLYWFDNAYHRLNKIEGYNPTDGSLTKCEFLKLKSIPAFSASTDGLDGSPTSFPSLPSAPNIDSSEEVPVTKKTASYGENNNVFYGQKTQEVYGLDNWVSKSSTQVYISGDSNNVYGNRVQLINCNSCTVGAGARDVTLINCDSLDLDSSATGFTFIANKKIGSWETKTADFTASSNVEGYFIDASGGDITVTIGDRNDYDDIIFKRVDNTPANTVTIDPTAAVTIDGDLTLKIKPYESFRLKYNATQTEYNIVN